MDYVLLSPEEVGTLLDLEADDVVALVESGELGGLRVAGQWRVPLKSIADLLASSGQEQDLRALERVFDDHETWSRVFGAHPEVTQSIDTGAFPQGSAGAWLREAIALARRRHERPADAPGGDPSPRDAGDADDVRAGRGRGDR